MELLDPKNQADLVRLGGWTGIANKLSSTKIKDNQFVNADNIDITDSGDAQVRPSVTSLASGSFRSMWSNKNGDFFGVKNDTLCSFIYNGTSIVSTTVLLAGLPSNDVWFEQVGFRTYVTNESWIRYIENGTLTSLPTLPTTKAYRFKRTLPPGNGLTYHSSRLYVWKGNLVVYSDSGGYDMYDERNDKAFFRFASDVKAWFSVEGGIWAGTEDEFFFLAGDSPYQMRRKPVLKEKVLGGSQAEDFFLMRGDNLNYIDKGCFITTNKGIYLGMEQGELISLTRNDYIMPATTRAKCAFLKGNINRFVSILN